MMKIFQNSPINLFLDEPQIQYVYISEKTKNIQDENMTLWTKDNVTEYNRSKAYPSYCLTAAISTNLT